MVLVMLLYIFVFFQIIAEAKRIMEARVVNKASTSIAFCIFSILFLSLSIDVFANVK